MFGLFTSFFFLIGFIFLSVPCVLGNQINPFEQGGPKRQRPAPIVRSAPAPPAPIPINPNVEFRGVFKYQGEWHFSLFNKGTNKGGWLKKGESFDDGKIEIEDFNPETEIIKLRGGMTLSLLKSKNQTLPVPSGQPVKKLPTISRPKITPRAPVAPGNRSPRTQIPPRVNSPRK